MLGTPHLCIHLSIFPLIQQHLLNTGHGVGTGENERDSPGRKIQQLARRA